MLQTMVSERRRTARYTVRVPIKVLAAGVGYTIDVSATGIAFVIDEELQPGVAIEFELALSESDSMLLCDGRVLRVESRGSANFIAATIENIAVKAATEH
jgi:hypothetical protein